MFHFLIFAVSSGDRLRSIVDRQQCFWKSPRSNISSLFVFNLEVDEKDLILLGQQPPKEGNKEGSGMGGRPLGAAVGGDNVG